MKKPFAIAMIILIVGCSSGDDIVGIYNTPDNTSQLTIKKIEKGFTAELIVSGPQENMCAGGISGKLTQIKENYYEIIGDSSASDCVLGVVFDKNQVDVSENDDSCRFYHGAMCSFNVDGLRKETKTESSVNVKYDSKKNFSEINGKHPKELFNNKTYAPIIQSILNPGTDPNFIRDYFDVSTGIAIKGEFLFGQGCVPHLCGSNEGFIVFNDRTGKVFIIIADVDDKKGITEFSTHGVNLSVQGNNGILSEPYPSVLKNWLSKFSLQLN